MERRTFLQITTGAIAAIVLPLSKQRTTVADAAKKPVQWTLVGPPKNWDEIKDELPRGLNYPKGLTKADMISLVQSTIDDMPGNKTLF